MADWAYMMWFDIRVAVGCWLCRVFGHAFRLEFDDFHEMGWPVCQRCGRNEYWRSVPRKGE